MPLDWGPNTVKYAAKWWCTKTQRAMAAMSRLAENRVYEVRYEDLVTSPEETVKAICEWLEIQYEPEMLTGEGFVRPSYTREQHASVGSAPMPEKASDWRSRLTSRQVEVFEAYAGDWLEALGYERVHAARTRVGLLTSAVMTVREVSRVPWNKMRYRRRYKAGAVE
jgi:hypothetical protein